MSTAIFLINVSAIARAQAGTMIRTASKDRLTCNANALEYKRRGEVIREKVIREEVIREEVIREEVIREEVIREEVTRENVIRGEKWE